MPQSFRLISIRATALLFVALTAVPTAPTHAQGPVLVPQTTGNSEAAFGGGSTVAEFGGSDKWIATADNGGTLLIFDIQSGRIAQNIDTRVAVAELVPHPSKDFVAILGGQEKYDTSGSTFIVIYEVTTGKEVWRKAISSRCSGLHYVADASKLSAFCSERLGRKPKNTLMSWDNATGAETLGIALPEGYSSTTSEDGRWISYANIHIFPNLRAPRPDHINQTVSQMYGKATGFIVDSETGQTVGTYPGMIAALSFKAHTAIVNTGAGLVLLQIPDNKTLGNLGPSVMNSTMDYTTVKVTKDGSKYILTSSSNISFVDAATGAIQPLPAMQLPRSATAAFAHDNDQVAVADGPTVTLFRLAKPDERRKIGSASAIAPPNLMAQISPANFRL